MSGFNKVNDERINYLFKEFQRVPSTSTGINNSRLETSLTSNNKVIFNKEIYTKSIPDTMLIYETMYSYVDSANVRKSIFGTDDNIDITGTAVDLFTANGLTETIWQAFKDGKLESVATTSSNANIVKIINLKLSFVSDTCNIGSSPSYYDSVLKDCLPNTIKN